MKRMYPIVLEKTCLECKKNFKRKKNYYGRTWTRVKYCSTKCFGHVMIRIQFERYKDETKHPRWKGDKVGYWGIHDWITKHYGQPKKCSECGKEQKRKKYHWANLSGKYLRNINDWKRMCVSCHRKYDYSKAKLGI